MKVLLVQTDLYGSVGGGQTVYRTIIETASQTEFYYFRLSEPADARRPSNAHALPLQAQRNVRPHTPPPYLQYICDAMSQADQIARSSIGHAFEIVDLPDFLTFGGFLRQAFDYHRVKVGRIVLAMHGNISDSIRLNWNCDAAGILDLRRLERAQFDAADGAYAVSKRYIAAWQSIIDRPVGYIDPAHFVRFRPSEKSWSTRAPSRPSLYCIGRSERRKGNDLFVELVRWLDRSTFDKAAHMGEVDYDGGRASSDRLAEMSRRRGIPVEYENQGNRDELYRLFAKPTIAILPTRYDTLNLVALEALFSGCPLIISTAAGACDYLDEAHSHLPYTKIELPRIYHSVAAVRDVIENYDERRRVLHDRLAEQPTAPAAKLDITSIYQDALSKPARIPNWENTVDFRAPGPSGAKVVGYRAAGANVGAYVVSKPTLRRRAVHLVRRYSPAPLKRRLRSLVLARHRMSMNRIIESGYLGDARALRAAFDGWSLPERLKRIGGMGETSKGAFSDKLRALYDHGSSTLCRCNFWLDIARIERLRGNELVAVAYELRALRLTGRRIPELLPRVTDTLRRRGFENEATAAEAMFDDPLTSDERVYDLLKKGYVRGQGYQVKPFAVCDDRRGPATSKVAVVVSLYNAADKLELFLDALSQQTLLRANQVEVVLVDSNSPSNEHAVLDKFLARQPLNVVYARSRERETIQAAWNRGIALARAPYLVFLGVDETLYPEALEVLAGQLDQNPSTDWVMSNSLVTEVDDHGVHRRDVMTYNRSGANKDHVYLETCYLSWVGGMYRKTLHDRFGYYDEAFGAAGDTEFKNRILPHINVRFVEQMLGLFLNYPDGQTTASPKAEIEDLRAWYMHRTPGGIRYAFDNRPLEDAEALLRRSLGYRKSYCGHLSSDVEYAYYLASYVKARKPNSDLANAVLPGLGEMLQNMRALELTDSLPGTFDGFRAIVDAWLTSRRYEREHKSALGNSAAPHYRVLNDNRYEQHSWLWRSV